MIDFLFKKMKKLNVEPMKPFSCFIQKIENGIVKKVFVNFGIVVCTASNSLKNIFVPKTPSKKTLNFFAEKRDIGFNTIDTGAKGCICLSISLKGIDLTLSDAVTEWEQSVFSKNSQAFITYIQKYLTEDIIRDYITEDLQLIDLANPKLGMENGVFLPIWKKIDPSIEGYDKAVEDIKRDLAYEQSLFKNWSPDISAYYDIGNPENPLEDVTFVFQPGKLLGSSLLTPLINASCIISDVSIKFIPSSTQSKEEEEKLDKYNFIINGEKLIPIAYIDSSAKDKLEQIIDFDYIFNFPFYFDEKNSKKFKK
jgi:hypothetical protein